MHFQSNHSMDIIKIMVRKIGEQAEKQRDKRRKRIDI
jgi:hypothetical protein